MNETEILSKFDPTNPDAAMQLAHAALDLVRAVKIAQQFSWFEPRRGQHIIDAARRVSHALNIHFHKSTTALESDYEKISRILLD